MTTKKPTTKKETLEVSNQVKLLKKLHAIMESVDYIAKDKRNDFQKYDYASEYSIKATLREEFKKHNILFKLDFQHMPSVIKPEGQDQVFTTIDVKYFFIDVDTGEALDGYFAGQGADKGDKGLYKAVTGAIKYILTTQFLIPTGDDPEVHGIIKREKPSCESCGKDMERFKDCYGCRDCETKAPLK